MNAITHSLKNYTNYSNFFENEDFFALVTHKEVDFSSIKSFESLNQGPVINKKKLVFGNQTHSSNVVIPNKAGLFNDVDGFVSSSKYLVLSIRIADCVPLFLFDTANNYFAVVHSGWRGASKNIASIAIRKMKAIGSRAFNIKAVIGPSIDRCCFEVGPDVSSKFNSIFSVLNSKSKPMLNLKNIIHYQLLNENINRKNILTDTDCTYCSSEKYFSYRRQGDRSGRMIALAGWIKYAT